MVDRFEPQPADWSLWGQLVKDWAKGTMPRPKNIEELKTQCVQRGMAVPHVPDYVKGLVFVQNDRHVLTIRLPPKDTLEATEQELQPPTATYTLPEFYSEFFQAIPLQGDQRFKLHASRIGEYAINSCI